MKKSNGSNDGAAGSIGIVVVILLGVLMMTLYKSDAINKWSDSGYQSALAR